MTISQRIEALEIELGHRERAASHLHGIPARQNSTEIAKLYDVLTDLHIRRIEGAAA